MFAQPTTTYKTILRLGENKKFDSLETKGPDFYLYCLWPKLNYKLDNELQLPVRRSTHPPLDFDENNPQQNQIFSFVVLWSEFSKHNSRQTSILEAKKNQEKRLRKLCFPYCSLCADLLVFIRVTLKLCIFINWNIFCHLWMEVIFLFIWKYLYLLSQI